MVAAASVASAGIGDVAPECGPSDPLGYGVTLTWTMPGGEEQPQRFEELLVEHIPPAAISLEFDISEHEAEPMTFVDSAPPSTAMPPARWC